MAKKLYKAANTHREVSGFGITPTRIYQILRSLAAEPISVGSAGDAFITLDTVRYGKTAVIGTVKKPIPQWDANYIDRISVGIAHVKGKLVLRVGPARKCRIRFKHVSETSPEDWYDAVAFSDKRMYKVRKVALQAIADKFEELIKQAVQQSA